MLYTVYFEIFGKEMQTKIDARNIEEAKSKVRDRIKFHKVVPDEESLSQYFKDLIKDVLK
jgi:hypothetical protein